MPLYIGDYLVDTTHLTRAQHGSYLLILMAMWKAGGQLEYDEEDLATIGKMSAEEWSIEGRKLMRFFVEKDGYITQKRLSAELESARRISGERRAAGKSGADARWSQHDSKRDGKSDSKDNGDTEDDDNNTDRDDQQKNGKHIAKLSQNDTPSPTPTQSPAPSPSPEPAQKSKALRASRSPPAAGFAEFWSRYPKKVGKHEAERQWNLLNPDEDLRVTIMAALEEQKQSRQWSDPNFIKDPERWIKKRRWEDEVSRGTPVPQQRMAVDEWLKRSQ